jgi:hypothetical protein
MTTKPRYLRNKSKYNKSLIKVSGKPIEVKADNFSYLNELKGKLQIENNTQNICFDDVISYLRNVEEKK